MAPPPAPPPLTALASPRAAAPPAIDPAKVVRLMLAFFGDSEEPRARAIDAAAIPLPDHTLLAHSGHMTVAVERHHGGSLARIFHEGRGNCARGCARQVAREGRSKAWRAFAST